MKKVYKTITALLLVCIMVIPGSLTANAATIAFVTDYATLKTAIKNQTETIIILNDITLEDSLYINYSVAFASYTESTIYCASGKEHIVVSGTNITMTFQNVILNASIDDTVRLGGGIYSTANSLLIENGYIIQGSTAIYATGDLTIDGGTYGHGSRGIYCTGTFTLEDGTIEGNFLTGYGAGIYSTGTVTINGGNVVNNRAYGNIPCYGAGIYVSRGTLNINGGTISDNTVYGNGGGICLNNSTLNMRAGTISDNSALYYFYNNGGGIYAANSTLNIYGGTISGNQAGNGGGIYAASCVLNIIGGTINSNTPNNIYIN